MTAPLAGRRAGAAMQLIVATATSLSPAPTPAGNQLVDGLLADADRDLLADGLRMCAGMYLAVLACEARRLRLDPAAHLTDTLRLLGHVAAQLATREEAAP